MVLRKSRAAAVSDGPKPTFSLKLNKDSDVPGDLIKDLKKRKYEFAITKAALTEENITGQVLSNKIAKPKLKLYKTDYEIRHENFSKHILGLYRMTSVFILSCIPREHIVSHHRKSI